MNLQQLEYLVALDRIGSFSKAAAACHITQATLSTMIKKLEEELDLVLFDRKSKPLLTTDCGREIVEEARKVIYHARRVRELSSEVKGHVEGELRIGIIPTVSGNLLHRIIPSILEKYPRLHINIQELTTRSIITRLKSGELDVGIASTPLHLDDLEEEILYYEKLMVYGRAGKQKTRYINSKDINRDEVWLLEEGNCLADQAMHVCGLNSRDGDPNLHFRPQSFECLLNMVDQMEGLTLIPELYFLDLPSDRKTRVKDFMPPYPVREISMIYFRPYAKSRLIQVISSEIRALIAPLLQSETLKNSEMTIARI
jgi:LysR family transcriptional regulator, hydrogen peroxide-inducible genes activator